MSARSSVLYENSNATVFLIDIPTSIALAQELSEHQSRLTSTDARTYASQSISGQTAKRAKQLLSSDPLRTPYPVSLEPKTDAARAKVLERIPGPEKTFHSDIAEPLVGKALEDIRAHHQNGVDWCLHRRVLDKGPLEPGEAQLGKRRRERDTKELHGHKFLGLSGRSNRQSSVSRATDLTSQLPPLILAPGFNAFASISELFNLMVRNTSFEGAIAGVRYCSEMEDSIENTEQSLEHHRLTFFVPPLSSFLLCMLPISGRYVDHSSQSPPIPGLPQDKQFNLILFDPPWSNRSVRRSGHYRTQSYLDDGLLMRKIRHILRVHSVNRHSPSSSSSIVGNPSKETSTLSIAAIWITNSAKSRKIASDALRDADFCIHEEWIWIKTTTDGQPITPLDGLWRKPYEVLIIGKKTTKKEKKQKGYSESQNKDCSDGIIRRVIAAVPDVHSRKPNLRGIFEKIFFTSGSSPTDGFRGSGGGSGSGLGYSALEVFARNLTAGWWACGDEVLKFNAEEWWVDC